MMPDPYHNLTESDLMDCVRRAKSGDKNAIRTLADIAQRAIYEGRQMPTVLQFYLAGVLFRIADGTAFNYAFSPLGRVPPEITAKRREAEERSITQAVDSARDLGMVTSVDGEIGPAFVQAGEVLGIPPATVKRRYYEVRQKVMDRWRLSPWFDIVEKINSRFSQDR